jgi:2-polyprenyl-3-methyl-5-hydroxy-6-metoxy-1,4-benzoquinol methylase
MSQREDENRTAQHAWNTNAEFWDERMAEGNDFFNILVWPVIEKFLRPAAGDRLLDVACGNGLTSRRLANAKARVTAFDFSEAMITCAKRRPGGSEIDYRVIDATDREALFHLGERAFDGALCNMALMDIANIDPLMNALAYVLRPAGRFVFSVLHPCFNNPAAIQMGELEDRIGTIVTTYSVKISRYLTPSTGRTRDAGATATSPLFSPASQRFACSRVRSGFDSGRVRGARFPSGYSCWQ